MFETPPIAQLVDELPQKSLTTFLLRSLDLVAPGEWGNPTGFDSLIRQTSGETSQRRLRTLREVAERIYEDPSEGYEKALWTYRPVDLTDRAIAAAAVADKLGDRGGRSGSGRC